MLSADFLLSRCLLVALVVAWPFVFPLTQVPYANFWPLMSSWVCGLVLWMVWWWGAWRGCSGAGLRDGAGAWTRALAVGLVLGAGVGAAVGLVQYFQGGQGLQPWVSLSAPGQAIGNLRQRNQQASLLSLGLWSLLWLLAQTRSYVASAGNALPDYAAGPRWTPRRWVAPGWLGTGMLLLTLGLLVLASAATTSRTGLLEWLVIVGLLLCWRSSLGRGVLWLALLGSVLYALAAWQLPQWLWHWTGVQAEGLFGRLGLENQACASRRVLWANVWHLIAQKPWLGWGWGELDYAHYVTLFPGERFCQLLDNAHNLPLHLAVELGLPLALLLCGGVLVWVLYARPWHETQPARQWAWGVLAIIGLHSLLEFPLWYGPFQLAALLALAVLVGPRCVQWCRTPLLLAGQAIIMVALCLAGGYALWDYQRLSQVFLPPQQRSAWFAGDVLSQAARTWLFTDHASFAQLSTTPVTNATALQTYGLANQLLHFSPEPRVIEALIESATLLGRDDEVAFHLRRYRAAYPEDFARWQQKQRLVPPRLS